MACDRFIYWTTQTPSREHVTQALRQYLGEAGHLEEHGDRVIATLPGAPSAIWEGLAELYRPPLHDERWFEVWFGDGCIDVITRMSDAYTSAVADGFALAVARFWDGSMGEG